jgi:5'-nucleotidase (lipoprotein e(P4) family)
MTVSREDGMYKKHGWIVLIVGLVSGCASTAPTPNETRQELRLPLEIHWTRNSAEYRAVVEQTFRLAGEVVERRSSGRQQGTWAVAIDADETLIGNSLQSKERALGSGGPFEEVWDEWVQRREAPALPGAKLFLERVRGLGGRVAVVTNRRARHCDATVDNLRALRIPFDVILCRIDTGDKNARWRAVEEGTADADLPPLEIVMWVGDNIHDFPGLGQDLRLASPEAFSDFGDKYFVLPNPLYGSWEENPQD